MGHFINAAAPVISGAGRVVNLTTFQVAYDFKSADLTTLAALLSGVPVVCHSSFVVTWPTGQVREFLVSQPVVLYATAF